MGGCSFSTASLCARRDFVHQIQIVIESCDRAIVAEDFDTLMENYTENAVLVVQPGTNAVGKSEIRQAFERIAVYFKHGLQVEQAGMKIIESADTALVLAKTIVSAPNQPIEQRKATYVFSKIDGRWLCSIDNSYGHQILEPSA